MTGRVCLILTGSLLAWGCAAWRPVPNISEMAPGDLGRVRMTMADSSRVSLKNAVLVDSGIVGETQGHSVLVPLGQVSRIERHETDGFQIFVVANTASFMALMLMSHVGGGSPPPPPLVR
jgi:hypothetical protein